MREWKIIVVSLLALASTSFANEAGLDGVWSFGFEENGTGFEIAMKVEGNQLTMSNTCTSNGESTLVEVTSKIERTENYIQPLEEKSLSVEGCEIEITQERAYYIADQDYLYLGGKPLTGSDDPAIEVIFERSR